MGRRSLAEERRAQITEAYYRCLVKKGIEGCSFANIAAEAGVPKGTLTHYFENKDEMALELTKRTIEKYETTYLERLDGIGGGGERLDSALSMIFADEFIEPELVRAFIAVLYRATRNKLIRDVFVQLYDRFCLYLQYLILEAAGSKEVDPLEIEQAAVSIIALMDGIQGHWLVNPEKVRLDMALDAARAIVASVLRGGRA